MGRGASVLVDAQHLFAVWLLLRQYRLWSIKKLTLDSLDLESALQLIPAY
jgi:hypothetical protein